MSVTMKQIAELAGVSRATVDKVLNGRPGVKPATKEKILQITKALHYEPNILGKALVSTEPIKIGIILTPAYNPFIGEMLAGIEQAEKEFSVFNLQILTRTLTTLEPEEQADVLRDLQKEHIAGLAVFPLDDSRVKDLAKAFAADGTAVITFNSRAEDLESLCFIGQDHKKGGAVAAGLFEKMLPDGGEIGVIISSRALSCHKDRLSGFKSRLQKTGAFRILEVEENEDQPNRALAITEAYHKRYPALSGIYLTGGGIAGCAEALAAANPAKRIACICHDVTPEAQSLLRTGVLDFIIDQSPKLQGYQIVKTLFEILIKRQTPPPWIEIPVGIVTAESL